MPRRTVLIERVDLGVVATPSLVDEDTSSNFAVKTGEVSLPRDVTASADARVGNELTIFPPR